MMTLRTNLRAVVKDYVHNSNDGLSNELESQIVDFVTETKMKEIQSVKDDIAIGTKSRHKKTSRGSTREGVWVYCEPTVQDWMFKRYESIDDAIRAAINYFGNVKIVSNGKIVNWDILDDKKAVYEDVTNDDRFIEVMV